ncbi:MAG: SDR family oxidoreductase [Spongiibacteraceae bacterium]
MDLGIKGKVAFVSGGTRGIGRAAAEHLVADGCKVIVVGRSQQSVDSAVREMSKNGGIVAGVAANLTDPVDIKRAVQFARDTFGSPDIVVTNVHLGDGGADGDGSFESLTTKDYEDAFRDLTMSVVHLTREVIPAMKEKRWGRLINVGSGAAKEPPVEMEHLLHNIARAPVVLLNKSLANDLGPYGITVNTIGTGWIATEAVQKYARDMQIEEGDIENWVKDNFDIPVNRFGQPEEEGALIAFLASDFAGYITGNWIACDGGQHRSAW